MIQNCGRIEFYESLILVFVMTCRLIDTQRHKDTFPQRDYITAFTIEFHSKIRINFTLNSTPDFIKWLNIE
jgi:hypothetical protein